MTGRRRGFVLASAVFLWCITGSAGAQVRDGAAPVTAKGSATIAGVVVAAGETARPLRRTLLTLTGPNLSTGLLALSDDEGRFEFRELPMGRYSLAARKTGYVRDMYGARPVGIGAGVPIAVKDGDRATVTMRLVPSAAFGGRVVMPPGAPVSSIRLQVLKWTTVNGSRQLVPARGGAYGVGGSGEYRISGLPPGEYVLAAYPFGRPVSRTQTEDGPGAVVGMAAVYSPGTTDPSRAQGIKLSAGDERTGVDLVMDFVEMGRISGRVVGPDGQPVPFAQLNTAVNSPLNPFVQPVRTAADGTFVLPAVVPGTMTIVARGAVPGTEQTRAQFSQGPPVPLWAHETTTVNPGASIDGLELRLRAGRTIRGRLEPDGEQTGPASKPAGLLVLLTAADPGSNVIGIPPAEPSADGTFEIRGVAPGQYRLQVNLPESIRAGWVVTSMTADGRDVLDAPVVVNGDEDVVLRVGFSNEPSVLAGTVLGPSGVPMPEHSVIVFSTVRAHWTLPSRRVAHVRTGADGTYEVRGLPDGEYHAVAVADLASEDSLTVEFLEALVGAGARVTVKNRTRTLQNLTMPGR